MSTISINKIIKLTSTVVSGGFTEVKLIANVLTQNELVPISPNPILSFNSYDAVVSYFGVNSNEAMFASNYFLSFAGTTKLPSSILFSRFQNPANQPAGTPAYLLTKPIKNAANVVAAVKALTAPALTLVINGSNRVLTLAQSDFASITGLSDIATILSDKLDDLIPSASVSINNNNGVRFFVNSTDSTVLIPTSTISYALDSNLSVLLLMNESSAPIISQGAPVLTPAENMDRIINLNQNWFSFTYVNRLTGDTSQLGYPITIALAKWANTRNNNFVFFPWEADVIALNPASTTNMCAAFRNAGLATRIPDDVTGQVIYNVPMSLIYGGTLNTTTNEIFGSYAGFYAGMGASINYNVINGKINFAGKRQSGLPTNVSNDIDYDNLLLQAYQVYGAFSSRATGYQFTEVGSVGGIYLWLDNIYDATWLGDQIQNSLATLIGNTNRIPYNQQGQEQIRAVLNSIAQRGLLNSVIEPGNTFSAVQKIKMIELTGRDVTQQMTDTGYVIYFAPLTPEGRANRSPVEVGFMYTNGGAINQIAVAQVFVV